MTAIPLATKLRKRMHREVAFAQDLLVMEAFDIFPHAVLHGGTAVWRCYRGNRFSQDVDLYTSTADDGNEERFIDRLRLRGLEKLKFKKTANMIHAKFTYQDAIVSLETTPRRSGERTVRPYETFDGSFMAVATLSPEELVLEKTAAYASRRKVRDLYDVYFLLQLVEQREKVLKSVRILVDRFQNPEDAGSLRAIIISGVAPSVADMLEWIRNWAR